MKSFFLNIFFLIFSLQITAQNRYYVSQSASGGNSGASWIDAFTDLQSALQLAQSGDEIWVAEGIYQPTSGADRTVSFELASGVRLYGGFAGTETVLSQRDWTVHITILSGDIGITGESTDNSFNILYLENPDANTLVDGLTFRDGQADNLNTTNFGDRGNSGAALYIMAYDDEAYPDIRNCTFERHYAYGNGGAVYVNGAGGGSVAPRFLNCTFRHNRARRDGGALYRDGGSWIERAPDFGYCRFEDNRAQRNGGGLLWRDSDGLDTLNITGCIFSGNHAELNGGGFDIQTGRPDGSRFVIDSCLIEKNRADLGSGARLWYKAIFQPTVYARIANTEWNENGDSTSGSIIYSSLFPPDAEGGLMIIEDCIFRGNMVIARLLNFGELDTTIIRRCKFVYNRLWYGGGNISFLLFLSKEDRTLESCIFQNNKGVNGGFLFLDLINYPLFKIYNNIFANNLRVNYSYFSRLDGTGLNLLPSAIQHCTFFRNDNSVPPPINPLQYNIRYENSAFYDKVSPALLLNSNKPVILHHCYFDSLDCDALPNVTCDDGMVIGGDPGFRDTAIGDFRLLPCSPLRDAGLNIGLDTIPYDFEGAPRIQGGTVDIGAYESPAFGLAAEPSVKAACDSVANGAISVPLVSACEPLAVSWQSGNQSGAALDGLAPGFYAVTVTDAKGQSVVFNASVPAASSPTLQVDGQPISCFGADDALLSVMVLSGQPPFSYLWSPTGTTDSVDTNLAPGLAAVTVTDATGCTSTFSFDIPEPDTLQFVATVQDASGQQNADGSILVNVVTGGTPSYDFLWSPGGSTEDMLQNLLPGFYTLTVTDERGCEAAWTFEVKAIIGTDEAQERAMLLIYPNPAGASATVAGASLREAPAVLELYDASGRALHSMALHGNGSVWQISLEGLARGAYMVQLKDKNGTVSGVGRLVKQ